jgi:hypothetical protein
MKIQILPPKKLKIFIKDCRQLDLKFEAGAYGWGEKFVDKIYILSKINMMSSFLN